MARTPYIPRPANNATKEEKDAFYNFLCPGCERRRNRRASVLIFLPAVTPEGEHPMVRYCHACSEAVTDALSPMSPAPRATSIDRLETRGPAPRFARPVDSAPEPARVGKRVGPEWWRVRVIEEKGGG